MTGVIRGETAARAARRQERAAAALTLAAFAPLGLTPPCITGSEAGIHGSAFAHQLNASSSSEAHRAAAVHNAIATNMRSCIASAVDSWLINRSLLSNEIAIYAIERSAAMGESSHRPARRQRRPGRSQRRSACASIAVDLTSRFPLPHDAHARFRRTRFLPLRRCCGPMPRSMPTVERGQPRYF
jgi:hypothetical protein